MKKLEYVIQKEAGLHMKEAVEFVDMTEEFRSEIEVEKKGRQTLRYCPRRR